MTFRFKPHNPDADEFHLSLSSWGRILERGVGLVVGYGPSITPRLIWQEARDGVFISNNDGFCVTAEEAQAMALVAMGLASVYRGHHEVWAETPDKSKFAGAEPPSEELIADLLRFSLFAAKSGGFEVH